VTGEFINPNWHVVLIHLPLGLVIVGFLIELFSFMWRRSGFRAAGRWMLLIGALAGIPTATSGIYAARDVLSGEDYRTITWTEIKQTTELNEHELHHLERHFWFNVSSTAVLAITVVSWIGCSDFWRRRLHLLFLLALLIGVGLLVIGGWYGGEQVYRHGVGVLPVQPESLSGVDGIAGPETEPQRDWHAQIKYFVPPLQLHVISAGWVVALALVTLGLSIRAISAADPHFRRDWPEGHVDEDIAQAFAARPEEPAFRSELIETSERPLVDPPVRDVPAPRFWLVTALLALLTAAGGLWVVEPSSVQEAIDYLRNPDFLRPLAHSIVGASIVVLSLILAMITRWGPRRKVMLSIFAALLVLCLAAQVWLGVLMLFDTNGGSLIYRN
jgi:uncharacterized membrane protein